MNTNANTGVLHEPIRHLTFTDEFVNNAAAMGFQTLQQIIDQDEDTTAAHLAFSWKWFDELIMFLHKKNLVHLLDDPERIAKHAAQRRAPKTNTI